MAGRGYIFGVHYHNYAQQASNVIHVQPSVILAQWADENAWGSTDLWKKNNLANIEKGGHEPQYSNGEVTYGGIAYYTYATFNDGMLAYTRFWLQNSRYKNCMNLKTYEDSCRALGNSGWAQSGYRNPTSNYAGSALVEIIQANGYTIYDKNYNNVSGNPNVKPTTTNDKSNSSTATPTSYIKRPQLFHKGLTSPILVKSPSSIPTPKKKITSSAGALAKGTKNNIEGPERTLKTASLSFVGIIAILFFINHAFIPTETL